MFNLMTHQCEMLESMNNNDKGIIQCPTGGGKTFTFITDSRKYLKPGNVVLVVAPRILLLEQLFKEFDTHLKDIRYSHREISSKSRTLRRKGVRAPFPVDSATTFVDEIRVSYEKAQEAQVPLILFTTYDSLERVVQSGIPVEVTYYDEAHNSASSLDDSKIYQSVKSLSLNISKRNYFFTATPKDSADTNGNGCGMNNPLVFGNKIYTVKFDYLISQGIIVTPSIHVMDSNADVGNVAEWKTNMETIREIVDHYEDTESNWNCSGGFINESIPNNKILFCAQGSKSIKDLLDHGIVKWAKERGYHVFATTSAHGKIIDGVKVKERDFLDTLNEMGSDPDKKLLVFHYSQIAEGIDVRGLTGVVFLRRSANEIYTTQTIGRVIRSYHGKKWGYVIIPRHQDNGSEINAQVENLVNMLLTQGVPPEVFIGESMGSKEKDDENDELLIDFNPQNPVIDAVYNWKHRNALKELIDSMVGNDDSLSV